MNKQQIAEVSAALALANGKRSERIATLADVAEVVVRVANGEPGTGLRRNCGGPAKYNHSYGYRSPATTIAAARVGDEVRVRIYQGDASLRESVNSDDVLALVARDGAYASGVIVLPVASAKRWPAA